MKNKKKGATYKDWYNFLGWNTGMWWRPSFRNSMVDNISHFLEIWTSDRRNTRILVVFVECPPISFGIDPLDLQSRLCSLGCSTAFRPSQVQPKHWCKRTPACGRPRSRDHVFEGSQKASSVALKEQPEGPYSGRVEAMKDLSTLDQPWSFSSFLLSTMGSNHRVRLVFGDPFERLFPGQCYQQNLFSSVRPCVSRADARSYGLLLSSKGSRPAPDSSAEKVPWFPAVFPMISLVSP